MDGDLERRITESRHVEVRPLTAGEVRAAGAVAARALRDNPMMVYSVPDDALLRLQVGYDTFVDRVSPGAVGALLGPHIVGVAAAGAPGACIAATAPAELRTPPGESPSDAVGV